MRLLNLLSTDSVRKKTRPPHKQSAGLLFLLIGCERAKIGYLFSLNFQQLNLENQCFARANVLTSTSITVGQV